MSELLRVLIVEDSEDDAELLAIELESGGYDVVYQRVDTKLDMEAALKNMIAWDLVLADYSMPRFSAIAAFNLLKEWEIDLPFIIVSGSIEVDIAVAAMKAGAHDYIPKAELARLVPAVERERREAVLRKEHRAAQERLRYLAFYDKLTNLPNRTLFIEHLSSELARDRDNATSSDLHEPSSLAVLLLSIDRFDGIKHSLGYQISEQLLIGVARRLEKCLVQDNSNIVARIGENEFALLVNDSNSSYNIFDRAEDIYNKLIKPIKIGNHIVCSTVSIGIALSQDNQQPEKLLQSADTALQYAKANFMETSVLFTEQMQTNAVEKLQLESDLQKAIDNKQLFLKYQPIVSLKTGKIRGVEALVRWQHDSLGTIFPDKFIPISEETGQIITLGEWVLSEACYQLINWRKSLNKDVSLTVSVNLSRIQIYHPELISQIDRLLETLNLEGKNLKLEITESTLMENTTAVTKVLHKLKERNIQLSIDDFGTGYSSLSYLRYLPVDTVKIDRSFIGLEINNTNYDIIRGIINLAHNLDLDVVAEGIETEDQKQILTDLGCEYGQGYLFAYPLNSQDVLKMIQS